MAADRLRSWSTEAEQAWLAGAGPEPTTPGDRAPLRAPVLHARAGGAAWGASASGTRVEVQGSDVVLVAPSGQTVLATGVRRVVWLVDGGERAARSAAVPLGYVVLDNGQDHAVGFPVAEWVPGEPVGKGSDVVRSAGFEALAHALGVPFEVLTRSEVVWRDGLRPVRAEVARRWVLAALVGALTFVGLLLTAVDLRAGLAALLLLPAGDVGLALARRFRRQPVARWASAGGRSGIGTADTGDLVVVDALGWTTWLPGPAAGGVVSAVVSGGALVLLDRDERQLLALPDAGGAESLLVDAGVVVSRADGTLQGLHVPRRAETRDGLVGEGGGSLAALLLSVLLLLAHPAWGLVASAAVAAVCLLLTRPWLAKRGSFRP